MTRTKILDHGYIEAVEHWGSGVLFRRASKIEEVGLDAPSRSPPIRFDTAHEVLGCTPKWH